MDKSFQGKSVSGLLGARIRNLCMYLACICYLSSPQWSLHDRSVGLHYRVISVLIKHDSSTFAFVNNFCSPSRYSSGNVIGKGKQSFIHQVAARNCRLSVIENCTIASCLFGQNTTQPTKNEIELLSCYINKREFPTLRVLTVMKRNSHRISPSLKWLRRTKMDVTSGQLPRCFSTSCKGLALKKNESQYIASTIKECNKHS